MICHPRPNRVTPFGGLDAVTDKGLFLGNRGDLHAADGSLSRRRWALKAWICCTLTSKSGNRVVFDRPGRYYPLFFADEATALAAGHRPCAMCRHGDYQRFKQCWQAARGAGGFLSAQSIDRDLHSARIDADRRQVRFASRLGDLPDGTMLVLDGAAGPARLLWRGATWRWSHGGYDDPRGAAPEVLADVLTPAPIVDVLAAGYKPVIHPSAG